MMHVRTIDSMGFDAMEFGCVEGAKVMSVSVDEYGIAEIVLEKDGIRYRLFATYRYSTQRARIAAVKF